MKLFRPKLFLLPITYLLFNFAYAETHSGKINRFHLNPDLDYRGACVQMDPAIPISTKWACLFDTERHLYKEFTSVLLTAYASKVTCQIVWTEVHESGHANLRTITCE